MSPISALQYDFNGGAVSCDQRSFRQEDTWLQAFLHVVYAGSAGVVVLVTGYGPYLPHVGTSPSVVDSRPAVRAPAPNVTEPTNEEIAPSALQALALSIADQTREVLAALSLNKTQLAEALGISRPTLYDWLNGKEPNVANAQRLTMMLRLLMSAGVNSSSPLSARFVRQALSERGRSLLDALCDDTLDERLVSSLMRKVKELGEQAESRRLKREERLRVLGFEDPSDEQRRDQLARNIAMRDWPKI